MKYNFKQIFALGTSALLIGMTAMMGGVGAANYPAPFVVGSQANVAVVYGTGSGVSATDQAQASQIASGLMGLVSGGIITVTGNAVTLASGSDFLYLNDDLAENVQTLTKDDLPVILADGSFTDDDGTDYDFEQTITIGTDSSNNFAFSDSDNDFDDPALMLDLSTNTANPMYTWTLTFDSAVNFTDSASEGEELNIFGKTYTVGTATDADTLILLGGSDAETIDIGATATLTIADVAYSVTLNGISDASIPVASISVNDETKTFEEGQTKAYVGDVDLYVKTIFRTGENAGHVEIQLGADKLTFETTNAVQEGSDNDDIDGTLITMSAVTALTSLTIAVASEDNDANHVLIGEPFIDPIFGTLKIDFASVLNGPVFTEEEDTSTSRNTLSIVSGGDRELQVTITDSSGTTETVPFGFNGALTDDDAKAIHVVEGATLADEEYFILNSGNYQHFMQLTKVDADSSGQVTFKDLFTGESHGTNSGTDHTSAKTVYISNQAYTITRVSDTTVTIASSDYGLTNGDTISVFPYLELVSGEDHRVALTDDVTVLSEFNVSSGAALTITLTLPTGDVDVFGSDTDKITVGAEEITVAGTASIQVGTVYYNFAVTDGTGVNATNLVVAVDIEAITDGDAPETDPGLLFVEDADKSEDTPTTKNAIVISTQDDSSNMEVNSSTLIFVGSVYDYETWDDTDFVGYLTNFGTYVLKDASDSDQTLASLTYPDEQMYAEVYFAESGAVVSGDGIDAILVTDAEVSTVQSKNLVVVGGSCINSVAATLVGGSLCTTSWTTETDVGTGQFLIKSYANPYVTGNQIALLVAGYAMDDTVNAATYLRNIGVNTAVGNTYIGTTSTSATLQVS